MDNNRVNFNSVHLSSIFKRKDEVAQFLKCYNCGFLFAKCDMNDLPTEFGNPCHLTIVCRLRRQQPKDPLFSRPPFSCASPC